MAAPPILVFDQAGNFIKAWGGAGSGYEWIEREHGLHIDYKGFVWLGGNNCPGLKLPGLKPVADDQLLKFTPDGKLVLQIGARTSMVTDTKTCTARRRLGLSADQRRSADGYGNHRHHLRCG
jgi:hypothetical protein